MERGRIVSISMTCVDYPTIVALQTEVVRINLIGQRLA